VRQPSGMTPDTIKIEMFVCKDECHLPLVLPKSLPVGTVPGKVMSGR
jgi:hypothetical protein